MSYRTERNENSMIGTFPFSLWVFVGTHAQIMRPNAAVWSLLFRVRVLKNTGSEGVDLCLFLPVSSMRRCVLLHCKCEAPKEWREGGTWFRDRRAGFGSISRWQGIQGETIPSRIP